MDPRPRSLAHLDCTPQLHESVYVAEDAILIGDIVIGAASSVWYGCVLRADINTIRIGANTNLQDGTIIHLADRYGTEVGDWVTVGHRALLHACKVEDEVLIGMSATVMDGAVVGSRSIIGAGALVTPGMEIPPGSMVLGVPAKVTRPLTDAEQANLRVMAERYVFTSREYLKRAKN